MTILCSIRNKTCQSLQHHLLQAQATHVFDNLHILVRCASYFKPQRVLVLTKISRYQMEREREPTLDESLLKKRLLERGADYDVILAAHHRNKETETRTIEVLKKLDISYKIIDRFSINTPSIEWADLVLPIGGDGTFLLASNLMMDNKKPIIGINSDPSSSEGHLLLPPKYTNDIASIFDRLRSGHYTVLKRTRIRTTIKGENIWSTAFHLHDKGIVTSKQRFYNQYDKGIEDFPRQRQLPWLALNEVFIGESHSARTSSLLISINDDETFHKVKSSGLCVSTGTGSTSWYKAMNCQTSQNVKNMFRVAKCETFFTDEQFDQIAQDYNTSLQFSPSVKKLGYSVRDMIKHENLSLLNYMLPRGFSRKLTVRSLCFDAGLVLDGGISVPFNAGTSAVFETHPDDALRHFIMD